MSEQILVEGGVPVAPDVNRIRETFPDKDLEVGQVIYHGEMETLIGESQRSARYRTVTNKWRSEVEYASGKVILAARGVGFEVADDHAKYKESVGRAKTAVHYAKRSLTIATLTDREKLEEGERRRLDSTSLISGMLITRAAMEEKRLKKGYLSAGGVG